MAPSTPCFDHELLHSYLTEELDESHEDRVQEHLENCSVCRQALEKVAGSSELWSELRAHMADIPSAEESVPDEMLELVALLDRSDDPHKLGRIGSYEICGMIGRGTTGLVLKALESRLNRFVAIKLMSPAYQVNGSARRRFEREGRAVAAVSHEHVVPIYAVDDHRGLPYIVMKYIPGLSLAQRIERDGPLDSFEVARVGLQVAQGLAAAHGQGIVHRDVKPANVILEDTVERAMVTDFGLARVADEASMTHSGTISGTPHYMSPEQARGDLVDSRSDLFSLGSLLYAACTGRPPFRAENVFGVIHRVCKTEARSIRDINPAIDPILVALIEKLMAKPPQERFSSAEAVAEALASELAYMQNPCAESVPVRAWLPAQVSVPGTLPRALKRALAPALAVGLLALGVWGFLSLGAEESQDADSDHSAAQAAFFPSLGSFRFEDPAEQGNSAQASADLGDGWQGIEVQSDEGTRMVFGQNVVHRFPATELRTLKMDLSRGDVSIKAGHVDSIVVTVQSQWATADLAGAKEVASGVSPVVETAQSELQWSDGWSSLSNPALLAGVAYRVEVPESMEPEIRTLDGSITIAGIGGNASMEANGRIVIGQMGGAIEARSNGGNITMVSGNDQKADLLTIGGDIWVANSDGGVRARASDGDVYLGRSTGDLFAQVSGGDIYVSEIGGPAGGHTSGGNVYMLLNESPAGDSNFSSAGGSVYVRVREGIAGTIQTRAPLQSTLEFQELPSTQGGEPFSQCDLNGGGALLQYVCSSGVLNVEFTDPDSKGDARLTGLDPLGAGAAAAASGGKGQASSKGLLDPAESSDSARGLGGSAATSKGHASSAKGLDSSSGAEGSASGPSSGGGLSGSAVASGPASGPSLGGSGSASGQAPARLSAGALERTSGAPRAGALATVLLENPVGNIDGYTLYLPRSFDERDGPFPILVYLQGAYGVGGRVSDLNNWGLARLLRDETDMGLERNRLLLDEFIVVSLHIQSGDYHEHPTIVDDILKRMVTQYKGDADRISVTGLSRGGHGTWGMAAELPGRFAAIAPVGGHAGDMDDFKKVQNTAVWIAHNRDDITVRFENADQAMKQIEGITGKPFTELTPAQVPTSDYLSQQFLLTSSANGGHDAWTDLYTSAEFYKWLLAQKRMVEAE